MRVSRETLRRIAPCLTPLVIPTLARADVAGTMAAGGNWLIGVIVAASILIIIVGCVMIASGRASLLGCLGIIGGLAAATNPEEIQSWIIRR